MCGVVHTIRVFSQFGIKYKPWKIRSYFAFDSKEKAEAFEKFLKGHSGRDFQKKYL